MRLSKLDPVTESDRDADHVGMVVEKPPAEHHDWDHSKIPNHLTNWHTTDVAGLKSDMVFASIESHTISKRNIA